MNYYGDNDPFVCQWLRNLIGAGHLPAGDVDDRDIREVEPDDLRGYEQVHMFCGIGGWVRALELAGWDGPVWTGSCPCQPFSSAGARQGTDDPRHLWPTWFRLIEKCRPAVIFGEQVEAAIGMGWWDLVADSLESVGYSAAGMVLPASAVGAPHIRSRLFFVAECGANSDNRLLAPHSRTAHDIETLSNMWEGEAPDGFLLGEEIVRRKALLLQGVRPCQTNPLFDWADGRAVGTAQTTASKASPDGSGICDAIPEQAPRTPVGSTRSEQSQALRSAIRFERPLGGVRGAGQADALRNDRDRVEGKWAEGFQQPVSGQKVALEGLRLQQRSCGVLGDELRDGDMGRRNVGDGGGGMERQEQVDDGARVSTHDEGDRHSGRADDSGVEGVGAPHIRQRLWWVADAQRDRAITRPKPPATQAKIRAGRRDGAESSDNGSDGGLGFPEGDGRLGRAHDDDEGRRQRASGPAGEAGGMGDADGARHALGTRHAGNDGAPPGETAGQAAEQASPWHPSDLIPCGDGKARRVEPGLQPLAHGVPGRVGKLRAYGNAIVPQVAAEFVRAYMETLP